MKHLLAQNLKKNILSPYFVTAALIILLSGLITYFRNQVVLGLAEAGPIGPENVFIYSNIKNNPGMSFLAPLVATACNIPLYRSIQSQLNGTAEGRALTQGYIGTQAISAGLTGVLVFLCTYAVSLALCFLLAPGQSEMLFAPFGQFEGIYRQSLFLYCLAFIAHSALFGLCYALFGMGLYCAMKSEFSALVLPVVLYYGTTFLNAFLPESVTNLAGYVIPSLTFEISTLDVPLLTHLTQLLAILLAALLCLYIFYRKECRRDRGAKEPLHKGMA